VEQGIDSTRSTRRRIIANGGMRAKQAAECWRAANRPVQASGNLATSASCSRGLRQPSSAAGQRRVV